MPELVTPWKTIKSVCRTTVGTWRSLERPPFAMRSSQAGPNSQYLHSRNYIHIKLSYNTESRKQNGCSANPRFCNWRQKRILTGTFGSGGEGWPWGSCAPLSWSCEEDSDLVLHIRIQMPQFVVGRVNDVGLSPGARGGSVFHLFEDDRTIPDDGICIWLDPQVCGPHSQQLWGGNGRGRFWKTMNKGH